METLKYLFVPSISGNKMVIAEVYITFDNRKQAEKILLILLKEKLIACYNLFPVASRHIWKGKLAKDNEIAALCKTKHALVPQIQNRVKALHSYEVPCIVSWLAEANKEYENWVFESTANMY